MKCDQTSPKQPAKIANQAEPDTLSQSGDLGSKYNNLDQGEPEDINDIRKDEDDCPLEFNEP